jgi:hypothetical protein
MTKCQTYDELVKTVEKCLSEIADTTTAQLQAFQKSEHAKVMELDKHLELMVGEKERSIGALREHMKEHHCYGPT